MGSTGCLAFPFPALCLLGASLQHHLLPLLYLALVDCEHVIHRLGKQIKCLAVALGALVLYWSPAATEGDKTPVFLHLEMLPVLDDPLDTFEPMFLCVLRQMLAHRNRVDGIWFPRDTSNARGLVNECFWLGE